MITLKEARETAKNECWRGRFGDALWLLNDRITELDNYTTRLLDTNSVRLKQIKELEARLQELGEGVT